jgi:hypothetical protein
MKGLLINKVCQLAKKNLVTYYQEGLSSELHNRIIWRELKPLHTWHHPSWLLFGFYPCEVLEIVVILMTSFSSSKMDFLWKTCCVFYVWRIYRFLI